MFEKRSEKQKETMRKWQQIGKTHELRKSYSSSCAVIGNRYQFSFKYEIIQEFNVKSHSIS